MFKKRFHQFASVCIFIVGIGGKRPGPVGDDGYERQKSLWSDWRYCRLQPHAVSRCAVWNHANQYEQPGRQPLRFHRSSAFGNLGHDALHGLGQVIMDLSLSRVFALRERVQLEARAEAFNFINHTNFSALSISSLAIVGIPTNLSSSTFGKPQSATDPRIFQFALKLKF